MAIPLLSYAPTTQNSRVAGFDISNDTNYRTFSTDNLLSPSDMDILIEAAYRQIYFHAFAADREKFLESQLRNGQITVREFIRGLLLSSTFTKSFYDLNNNYRFVEHCVQRALGRDVYSKQEKIAWSIVVATKGRAGFIDALLGSDEYLEAFGDSTVPYQRRRVLASGTSEVAFNIKSPRYDEYTRRKLGFPQSIWQSTVRSYKAQETQVRDGNPAAFLEMARSLGNLGNATSGTGAANVDMNRVPYRKLNY